MTTQYDDGINDINALAKNILSSSEKANINKLAKEKAAKKVTPVTYEYLNIDEMLNRVLNDPDFKSKLSVSNKNEEAFIEKYIEKFNTSDTIQELLSIQKTILKDEDEKLAYDIISSKMTNQITINKKQLDVEKKEEEKISNLMKDKLKLANDVKHEINRFTTAIMQNNVDIEIYKQQVCSQESKLHKLRKKLNEILMKKDDTKNNIGNKNQELENEEDDLKKVTEFIKTFKDELTKLVDGIYLPEELPSNSEDLGNVVKNKTIKQRIKENADIETQISDAIEKAVQIKSDIIKDARKYISNSNHIQDMETKFKTMLDDFETKIKERPEFLKKIEDRKKTLAGIINLEELVDKYKDRLNDSDMRDARARLDKYIRTTKDWVNFSEDDYNNDLTTWAVGRISDRLKWLREIVYDPSFDSIKNAAYYYKTNSDYINDPENIKHDVQTLCDCAFKGHLKYVLENKWTLPNETYSDTNAERWYTYGSSVRNHWDKVMDWIRAFDNAKFNIYTIYSKEINTNIKELEKNNKKLKGIIDTSIVGSREHIEALETIILNLNQELKEIEDEIESEIDEVKACNKDLEILIKQTNVMIKKVEDDNAKLADEILEFTKTYQNYMLHIEELKLRIDNINKLNENIDKEELVLQQSKQRKEELEAKIIDMEKRFNELTTLEIEQYEEYKRELKDNKNKLKESEDKLNEFRNEKAIKMEEAKKLANDKTQYNDLISQMKAIDKQINQIEEQKKKIEQNINEGEALASMAADSIAAIEDLLKRKEEAKKEIESYTKELERSKLIRVLVIILLVLICAICLFSIVSSIILGKKLYKHYDIFVVQDTAKFNTYSEEEQEFVKQWDTHVGLLSGAVVAFIVSFGAAFGVGFKFFHVSKEVDDAIKAVNESINKMNKLEKEDPNAHK